MKVLFLPQRIDAGTVYGPMAGSTAVAPISADSRIRIGAKIPAVRLVRIGDSAIVDAAGRIGAAAP